MEGFIFVFLFISVIAGPVRKSRIPLLDHMRTPLFAELDMTYTNEQLEHFILSEIENEVNEVNEVNDTNRKMIEKLIKSEIFEVKELIKYELGNLRSEMFANYSSELDSMRKSFERRISALENVSQYTELDSMKESFDRRISALENISQCTELEQNSTKEKNVQVKATVKDVQEMTENTGKDFYLAFLQSYYSSGHGHPYMYTVSNSTGTCRVNIPFQSINTTINISETVVNTFKMNSNFFLNKHGIQQKAMHVTCNVPVSIYGVTFVDNANDGFLTIPTPYLGRDYIISSFKVLHRYPPYSNSNFGIIGIHDSTNVTIKFRTTSGSVTYNKTQYNNNDVLQIQLDRMDTFYLSHDYDMSGTIISASKPVAVLSGLRTSFLRNGWGNHMAEMILSNDQLGHTFVVPTLYDSQCDFRILGQPRIAIRLYHQKMFTSVNIPINSYLDYNSYTISTVNTSGYIQVQLYCNGLYSRNDAFMVTLPSLQHFRSNYQFPVVSDFRNNYPPEQFYITVIIESNEITGLLLDNSPPRYSAVSNVTLNNQMYSVLSVNVSVGVHNIAQEDNIPFGLLVYGRNNGASGYGYPAGFALQNRLNSSVENHK